jgi:hypothetical protein
MKRHMMKKHPPTILCEPCGRDVLTFYCRYCDAWHHHHGDGHKDAQCVVPASPYRAAGYVLRAIVRRCRAA